MIFPLSRAFSLLSLTLTSVKGNNLELRCCREDVKVPGFIGDGTAGEHDLLGCVEAGLRQAGLKRPWQKLQDLWRQFRRSHPYLQRPIRLQQGVQDD